MKGREGKGRREGGREGGSRETAQAHEKREPFSDVCVLYVCVCLPAQVCVYVCRVFVGSSLRQSFIAGFFVSFFLSFLALFFF